MKTIIKKIIPPLATLLPAEIARELQRTALLEDPIALGRYTTNLMRTRPEFFRSEALAELALRDENGQPLPVKKGGRNG